MLIYTVLLMVFLSAYLLLYFGLGVAFRSKYTVAIRLNRIEKDNAREKDNELNQPLLIRIIHPILDGVSRTILKITPKELVSSFEKRVVMAGTPFNISVKDWINIQVVTILCFPIVTVAIGYYIGMEARNIVFIIMIEIGIGLILPNLLLSKQISDRQRKILNSLPDVLDLLTVSVEAGLGFDGALSKVVDKMPGALADEFGNVLQEMKVGKSKREALKDMSDRVCLPDLSTFIGAVIQADQLGVSIGNVLRIQSEQMRQRRRQRAQEKAMKAPVKMLIPMILFIFPTIFSVLLGPVAIRVMGTLMK
jgi:tight adherence protein C